MKSDRYEEEKTTEGGAAEKALWAVRRARDAAMGEVLSSSMDLDAIAKGIGGLGGI